MEEYSIAAQVRNIQYTFWRDSELGVHYSIERMAPPFLPFFRLSISVLLGHWTHCMVNKYNSFNGQ